MQEEIVPTFDKIVDQITRNRTSRDIKSGATINICILTKGNAPSNGLYQIGTLEEWTAKYYSGLDADTLGMSCITLASRW